MLPDACTGSLYTSNIVSTDPLQHPWQAVPAKVSQAWAPEGYLLLAAARTGSIVLVELRIPLLCLFTLQSMTTIVVHAACPRVAARGSPCLLRHVGRARWCQTSRAALSSGWHPSRLHLIDT